MPKYTPGCRECFLERSGRSYVVDPPGHRAFVQGGDSKSRPKRSLRPAPLFNEDTHYFAGQDYVTAWYDWIDKCEEAVAAGRAEPPEPDVMRFVKPKRANNVERDEQVRRRRRR